jgi:hypothetical protein
MITGTDDQSPEQIARTNRLRLAKEEGAGDGRFATRGKCPQEHGPSEELRLAREADTIQQQTGTGPKTKVKKRWK